MPRFQNQPALTLLLVWIGAMLVVIGLVGSTDKADDRAPLAAIGSPHASDSTPSLRAARPGMIPISAGEFPTDSRRADPPDTYLVHPVRQGSFYLDARHVTNRQFTAFIAATHYVTTAEQIGTSRVFDRSAARWRRVASADWRHPAGPDSSIAGRDNYPTVHVSWFDASAYAKWANKRLPTEVEYEYAARGGLAHADFAWGREEVPDGHYQANYWQGRFPQEDLGYDGYRGLAPVGRYRGNRFGLFDMAGNVWCWCSDPYRDAFSSGGLAARSRGLERGNDRVLRGGSWLSAKNFRFGIRTSARWHATPEYTANDVGFRCAADYAQSISN